MLLAKTNTSNQYGCIKEYNLALTQVQKNESWPNRDKEDINLRQIITLAF